MAQSTALSAVAIDLQVVRAFLERYCAIEHEIKVLQHDKSALRDECKGKGLDMKTMTAAIAIAKKRQRVPVSRETLDALSSEGEERLPAPEDEQRTGRGTPEEPLSLRSAACAIC